MSDMKALGSLVDSVQAGFWGHDEAHVGETPVRIIRNGDAASSPDIDLAELPTRWVTYAQRERARVDEGDIVLVSSGEVGRVARLVGVPNEPVIASNFVRRMRAARSVNASWLYHLLGSPPAQAAARRASGGTTLQNLSWTSYQAWEVPTADAAEQADIGRMLDEVDEQIRIADRALEKLQATKQGLIVDLLTRGISRGGTLRSPNERMCTVLGPLPSDWSVQRLDQLLANVDPAMRSGPFGSALLKHELVESGIPLLGIDNVHTDRFVADYQRFVTPAKASELRRYRVRPGDVMITIMGTVGRTCLVPSNIGHALSSKHVWTMTFDPDLYLPYLVAVQLNHAPWVLAQFRKDEQGGIMSAIRSDTLRSLLLPVPPINEQKRIAEVLAAVEQRIDTEQALRDKVQSIKAGLVVDLIFTNRLLSGPS